MKTNKSKPCTCCKKVLPLNKFQTTDWGDGHHTTCKKCMGKKVVEAKRTARLERESEGELQFIESDPIIIIFDREIESLKESVSYNQKQLKVLKDKRKRALAGDLKPRYDADIGEVVLD